MAAAAQEKVEDTEADGAERRRHRRVPVSLRARFLTPDGEEHSCIVANISAGGLRLVTEAIAPMETKIVLYVEQVGRFDCTVVRMTSDGFAVKFDIQAKKRERTVEALSRLLLDGPRASENRVEPRVATDSVATLTLESGEEAECRVIDISLTGASIAISPRPDIGAVVRLGRMSAKVMRHHEDGVGLAFQRSDASAGDAKLSDIVNSVEAPGSR